MAFKRMEGFAGSIPQRFIDNSVVKCPMCGTLEPNWSVDMKWEMQWRKGASYLFKCDKCNCILSTPVADVTGDERTPYTTIGFLKKMQGKKNAVTYITIEEVGNAQTTNLYK